MMVLYTPQPLYNTIFGAQTRSNLACVWGSPVVPLVGNICTICTNLIANGTIGKEIGANGKNGNTNSANVTNQWYHWKNPEHTLNQCYIFFYS